MQDSVVFDTKKKKFFNAGIVEQSVRFDTHGNSDAGNQLKDLTRSLESKYQFVIILILGVESFKINTDPTISL